MSFVTFRSDSGLIVRALLGEASPVLTSGFGGWEVVDRPKRIGMTRFKGTDPFRQDIAILLDGYADNVSQESKVSRLQMMARQPDVLQQPPTIKLEGMAQRTDLVWIIEGID